MIDLKKSYNLPKPLTVGDYEECVELVKKSAVGNQAIRALYLMGTKWCPGISDLDIVAVYKDSTKPQYLPDPWLLGEKAKFIFTHRYLSFDESTAQLFYYLYPKKSSKLRLVGGDPIEFAEPTIEENKWTLAFVLFDVLVNKLLLFEKFKSERNNIRNLLGELYSLVYTIGIVQALSGEKIGGEFGTRVTSLRENWFKILPEKAVQELSLLLTAGLEIVTQTVSAVDRFLLSQKISVQPNLFFSNDKYRIVFATNWTSEEYKKEFRKSLLGVIPFWNKKIESFRMVLPVSFSYFFLAYAEGDGEFSTEMRSNLFNPTSVKVPNALEKHISAMNSAFSVARATAGNFKIPFSFGFLFSRRKFKGVLLWKGLTLLRRIRV